MIHRIERYFQYSDERGSIEGLIQSGVWKEINLIISDKDCIRGRHYHKKTIELFIVLEGTVEVTTQTIINDVLTEDIGKNLVHEGDVFLIYPNILHTFHTKTDAKWINALSEPIINETPDIHYLQKNI